ncbi:MAG: manganese efflux pump MntP family protein [Treponema sp.]|nr:manganese efflux pump MntP family protein [Treponema sp.]
MQFSILFLLNSIGLGVGLAMDAFSVSIANGLKEPQMKTGRTFFIAGIYAFFQFLMPMIGWVCIHTIINIFEKFQPFIPWIALALLCYIGISMIIEGIKKDDEEENSKPLSLSVLLLQGIATSIDALSVGFSTAEYNALMAFISSLIIAVVTLIICLAGLKLGKKVGTKLSDKATIFGGIILIIIGLEIFIKGVFF